MKIRINKDVVEFTPEHAAEAAELEALWIKMGNCVGGNKALSPIGVYVPAQNKTAKRTSAASRVQHRLQRLCGPDCRWPD